MTERKEEKERKEGGRKQEGVQVSLDNLSLRISSPAQEQIFFSLTCSAHLSGQVRGEGEREGEKERAREGGRKKGGKEWKGRKLHPCYLASHISVFFLSLLFFTVTIFAFCLLPAFYH